MKLLKQELKSSTISQLIIDKFSIDLKEYNSIVNIKAQESSSEENLKNDLQQFLKVFGYQTELDCDKIDLTLWENGQLKTIIETKGVGSNDMIVELDFNRKSFHQALFYYMQQQAKSQNTIESILITDYKTMFIIREIIFKILSQRTPIKNAFNKYQKDKETCYKEFKEILARENYEIKYYLVDLSNYQQTYQLLSPEFLYNRPLSNDSNLLNREFYDELLYIMGLQEEKEGLVKSKVKNSLLDITEQIIGSDKKVESLFELALGLNILWLNRILFLKILESQLKTFRDNKEFSILSPDKITGYHLLSKLFFNILSTPKNERHEDDKRAYSLIPYLNSSLFEETELERSYGIKNLDIERKIVIKKDSVLYNEKSFKQKELTLLDYLLRFLNCYQFNNVGENLDSHTTIKSSVLGLVFEKLNGYKDGSHFTPASITMYMSKEVIQRKILDKFNQEFEISCADFEELKEFVYRNCYKGEELKKAQDIVNSISIIDPAVGSGHFLVSSLNELIRVKSELGLLHKDIKVDIEDDELIIKSSFGDEFVYQIKDGKVTLEKQAIQQAIFETKKHIIENQLYGIDINPNSVNICRLRLWIELLKHTYYTDKDYTDLEVLPNLEFKVMTANSLISVKDIPLYFNKTHRSELSQAMHIYYNARLTEKEEIKTQVKELISNVKSHIEQLKNYNPFDTVVSCSFFDSGLMFGIDQFDIVIGNPPYLSSKEISSAMMSEYKKEYGEQDDLYNYFYRRGFEFLKDDGILGYITSNTFLTIQSKQKLRQFLQGKRLIEMRLIDNVFESAAVEPIIVIAQNNEAHDYEFEYIDNRYNNDLLSNDHKLNVNINVFKNAPNQVFFTPNDYNLDIANHYFGTIHSLMISYWDVIKTSANIDKHRNMLNTYRSSLQAGDITLLGLLTDGGQGLATANNGYYIGVREGTKDAERTAQQRLKKITEFNKKYSTSYDITKMSELEIRKLFAQLKLEHGRDVFGQGFLYQIVSEDEIVDVNTLTQDEKDNGIEGKRSFVPYDKGDKDGNRWYMPTVYCINWNRDNVQTLKTDPKARWQGYNFFFREGFCWSDIHTLLIKGRLKEKTIHDVKSMSLFSLYDKTTTKYLLIIINSTFMSKYIFAFVNCTQTFQINDARQVPIIIPTPTQLKTAEELFDRAKSIKQQQIDQVISKNQADELLADIQTEVDRFVEELYGVRE